MRGAVSHERSRWTNETELHSQMQQKLTLTLQALDVRTMAPALAHCVAFTPHDARTKRQIHLLLVQSAMWGVALPEIRSNKLQASVTG